LDLANARLSSGLGLPSDVVTAETSKSQAVLALTVARDNEQQARVSLLQLLGVDPFTPISASASPEPAAPAGGPSALVETALRARPEVQAAVQAVRASHFGLSAARALDLPAIYAAVSAGVAGPTIPLKDNTFALGVGFQFPLYDGGARSGAIEQARGQITAAESDLKSALLGVRTDVLSAYLALTSAEQRVAVVETEVANAREGVRVAEGRYAAGLGLFQDITTAQGQLLDALTDESTVKNTLDLARTRLRHAIGQSV
jgi:outer membrane protein